MFSFHLVQFRRRNAVLALAIAVESGSADQTAPSKPNPNPDATTTGKAATPALVRRLRHTRVWQGDLAFPLAPGN